MNSEILKKINELSILLDKSNTSHSLVLYSLNMLIDITKEEYKKKYFCTDTEIRKIKSGIRRTLKNEMKETYPISVFRVDFKSKLDDVWTKEFVGKYTDNIDCEWTDEELFEDEVPYIYERHLESIVELTINNSKYSEIIKNRCLLNKIKNKLTKIRRNETS